MHGSYTFRNWKCLQNSTNLDCQILDGAPVPHGWNIHFSCDPGYTLNTTSASSICLGIGWTPPLETTCVVEPRCPPLKPVNGIVKCKFQGKEVPCDAPMKPGTKAGLKCKLHHRPVHGSENPQFLCLPNGHWDHLLLQCIPTCGHSKGAVQFSSLIYKGLNATVGLFPWHAGLYYREVSKAGTISWEQRCGGSLISDQFVLTAAHCVKDVKKQEIRIALGKYHRSWNHHEDTEEKRNVSQILIPILFNKNTLVFDIALVLLDEKIKYGEFIMPVCHGLLDGSNDVFGKHLLDTHIEYLYISARVYIAGDKLVEAIGHRTYGVLTYVRQDIYDVTISYNSYDGYIFNLEVSETTTLHMFCVPSATGENCGIYFNECQSNPCVYGNCTNDIINYHCECEDGYEGVNCEDEIDECERFKPCVHGSCLDLKASYYCSCISGYGGRNCSVQLTGCKTEPCLNNGSCKPYLGDESLQLFNCSCTHGYHGHTCDKPTTMSLNDTSFVEIITSQEKGYDLQFRFKTIIPSTNLASNPGYPDFNMELNQGILTLQTSLIDKVDGVSIGSGLDNGSWQKVTLAINVSHLLLVVNEEKLIHPINNNKTPHSEDNTEVDSSYHKTHFSVTVLTEPTLGSCLQDINIDGQLVLPNESQMNVTLVDIEVGCTRTSQCEPNPCQRGGECTDLWRKFRCTCTRPYVGEKCESDYTAATFWNENVDPSPVVVTLSKVAREALHSRVDISMFIRTRQKQSGIFYLGSKPSPSPTSTPGEDFIIAHLFEGELQVQIQVKGTSESYGVPDIKLDDGYYHLIQVVRDYSLVYININHTEYVSSYNGTNDEMDLQTLYLGGLPAVLRPTQHVNIARPASVSSKNPVPPAYFKGVIQNVQVSNGEQVMIAEFFPLEDSKATLYLPKPLGSVEINTTSVLRGVLFDDTCKSSPCVNNGTCRVIWNDYECNCTVGFRGKQCNDQDLCTTAYCPDGSRCQNLVYGYECVANLTLSEDSTGLQYRLVQGDLSSVLDTISIKYFSEGSGTLLHIFTQDMPHYYFKINQHETNVSNILEIAWNFKNDQNVLILGEFCNFAWNTITLKMDSMLSGGVIEAFGHRLQTLTPTYFPINEWHELLSSANIFIGSNGGRESLSTKEVSVNDDPFSSTYGGCIGEVRIGGLLLPYFSPELIMIDNTKDHFVLQDSTNSFSIGCHFSNKSYCENGCVNPKFSECQCVDGFMWFFCSIKEGLVKDKI